MGNWPGRQSNCSVKYQKILYEVALLEFTNLRDYLMTIIALANAHRSGVSANMMLTEFKRAKIDPKSGNVLLHVMNHKTLRKHGHAVVCLKKDWYI